MPTDTPTDTPTQSSAAPGPAPRPGHPAGGGPRPLGRIAIALLMSLGTLGQFGMNVMLPSLPAIAQDLQTAPGAERLVLSMFLIGFAGGQLLVGPLSDRFGRRSILMPGLLLYAAASAIAMFAPSLNLLLAARLLQGIGAAAGFVIARAIARDRFEGPALVRIFGLLTLSMGVVPGVAPVIGGFLQEAAGWQAGLAATALLGAAATVLCFAFIPETGSGSGTVLSVGSAARDYVSIVRERTFRRFGATNALALGSLYAFYAGGPELFIVHLGLSPQSFGWLACINAAAFMAGAASAARFSRWAGSPAKIMGYGVSAMLGTAVAMLALGIADLASVPTVMTAMALFSYGLGIVLTNGVAGALSPFKQRAASATAMLGALQMSAGAAASAVVAAFPAIPALIFPAVMTVMLGAALINIRRP